MWILFDLIVIDPQFITKEVFQKGFQTKIYILTFNYFKKVFWVDAFFKSKKRNEHYYLENFIMINCWEWKFAIWTAKIKKIDIDHDCKDVNKINEESRY